MTTPTQPLSPAARALVHYLVRRAIENTRGTSALQTAAKASPNYRHQRNPTARAPQTEE